MKETVKKIKEMSKNPRKKALLQLGAWMFFFLISYIVIILLPHPTPKYRSTSSTSNSNKEDAISNYVNWDNFEYTYTFTYQGKVEQVKGTYFDENYYFMYLDNEYYSTLGNIYKVDTIQKKLLLDNSFLVLLSTHELDKLNLKEMIELSTVLETKEYKDGKKITNYDYTKEEKTVLITVVEQDNNILEILLDYKNTYPAYDNLQVKLEYQEVNNLSSYSKNYLDYQVIVEGE